MPASAPDIPAAPPPLREALAAPDDSPVAYLRLARALAVDGAAAELGLRRLDVALLASFTVDVLLPYLVVEGARRGLDLRPTALPYGQLEQQVLDPDSALYRGAPGAVALALRIEDVAPSLAGGFGALSADGVAREVDELAARIDRLIRAVRERSPARLLVWNLPPPRRLAAGLADAGLERSQADAHAEVGRRIAASCRAVPDAHVFDVARVAAEVGLARWEDPKLTYLARSPFSAAGQVVLARRLARTLRALIVPPRKCLVVDLDNTLWGGVLGEDGVGGIACGEDYPGNVFKDFQRQLLAYRDRGVLLAIASKNNEADVLELFERHGDLALGLGDFAARQIHWGDKASSLAAIAAELGIGSDALAFFDDSPVERAWVRSRMPEVEVIEVPADPLRYGEALDAAGAFDSLIVTAEDRARAGQVRGEQQRRTLAAAAGSIEDFLRALEMRLRIGTIDGATAPRVAQLIGKTNQFNLTTRRHAQADVERMMAEGAIGLWLRVEDRFGDSGLVGVALAVPAAPAAFRLDTFLLSCRVLGRGVEGALLAAVVRRARRRGAAALDADFIASAKNAPARDFLPASGFLPLAGEVGRFRLDLAAALARAPAAAPWTLLEDTDHD